MFNLLLAPSPGQYARYLLQLDGVLLNRRLVCGTRETRRFPRRWIQRCDTTVRRRRSRSSEFCPISVFFRFTLLCALWRCFRSCERTSVHARVCRSRAPCASTPGEGCPTSLVLLRKVRYRWLYFARYLLIYCLVRAVRSMSWMNV